MLHYTRRTIRRATRRADEKVDPAMMGAMRKFSKSWVAVGLIGLLVIAFAAWGVSDAFTSRAPTDVVAKAGSHEVTLAEYKSSFDRAREQLSQQQQRPLTVEELVAAGYDQRILNGLASRVALSEVIERLGVRVGKDLYEKILPLSPDFYNPITGKFDPEAYKRVLAENGLTPAQHQQGVMEQIAEEHVLRALNVGFQASRTHVAARGAYIMQGRDARYLILDPSKVARPATPTDAQLKAFLNEVSAQAMKPEMRELTIVRFSSKAIAPTVQITPQDVQQVFDFRKDQLSAVETRTIVQVPAKSAAMAQTIAQRLAKGEDPAAVARSLGVTPVTYTDRPKTAIADRKVADVAFSLAAGQTSGPIAGDLGQAVVKVVSITPGKTVTLDDVRPQMEEEARNRAAEARLSDLADKFEAAIGSGSSVAEAAKAVGLTPVVTPPVTAQGQSEQPTPVAGLSPKLLETAFDLAQGADSELVQDAQGEYFVVHVNRVIPAALPTIDEVRQPLTQAFIAREHERRLRALADQLAERIRKGEAIEAVAASVGARTGSVSDLNRQTAQSQMATLGQSALGAIIGGKLNEVVVAPGAGGIVVAKVNAIRNGDVATLAQLTNQYRGELTNELGQEYQERIAQAARDATNLKVFPDNARRALGLDPAEAPAAKGQSTGKAG